MKYLVMVQGTQADYDAMGGGASAGGPAWSEEDIRAMFAFMQGLNDELARTGELLDAQGLAAPRLTRLVGLDEDGRPVITDDPYGPADVLMAGYWVLDCASLERVTEIATRIARSPQPAGAPDHPVVIRPVMEGGEEELLAG
ncbi:YciI family protein [Streptomyces sp. NPDC016309]|uniref:YciI family protein n=1 Tax=Streptomyces sp. NPDC016309 TaxID=3364965 RepID=UPI0036FEEA5F